MKKLMIAALSSLFTLSSYASIDLCQRQSLKGQQAESLFKAVQAWEGGKGKIVKFSKFECAFKEITKAKVAEYCEMDSVNRKTEKKFTELANIMTSLKTDGEVTLGEWRNYVIHEGSCEVNGKKYKCDYCLKGKAQI